MKFVGHKSKKFLEQKREDGIKFRRIRNKIRSSFFFIFYFFWQRMKLARSYIVFVTLGKKKNYSRQ